MQRPTRSTMNRRTEPLASTSAGPGSKSVNGHENIT
jgi:hypothetical protein